MKVKEHTLKSMENLQKNYPEIYKENKETLEEIISELHGWLDFFCGKKTEEYDYSGINCMKHREQRHHLEGIQEATRLFSKKYGDKFREIISSESESHIWEDIGKYLGRIPFESEYKQIGFWKELRGW